MRDGFQTMIAGKTGTGKSYFTKKKLIPILSKDKPVVIFDKKGEYSGHLAKDSEKSWNGFNSIYSFFDYLAEKKVLKKGVYVVNCNRDKDYVYGLALLDAIKPNLSLIIDEGHFIFKGKSTDLKKASDYVIRLVRYGRSYGTDVILISQRSYDIIPDIRSQFDSAFSFRQTHQSDVQALEGNGWTDSKKIVALKDREYISLGEVPGVLKSLIKK